MRRLLAGFTLLAVVSAGGHPSSALFAAPGEAVHVRASAPFAACLAPALDAFTRSTGVAVTLTSADPDPPQDADLVVGDDLEMTRLLEGGGADLASAADLGQVPWVLVVPEGSPPGSVSSFASGPIAVLAGRAGREARASLAAAPDRLDVINEPDSLRRARHALVPRSLAGSGARRPTGVRPLIATAALVTGSPRAVAARRLLAFLSGDGGRQALGGCFDPMPKAPVRAASAAGPAETRAAGYAQAVLDWWLPQCSLARNRYNDPEEVLGPPDAVNLGGGENYLGFMSLGQGGYVTVDVGTFADGPGPDVRVYQTVSGAGEPVSLYASNSPQGPFTLVGLRVPCGERSPGLFSNHCDFDLSAGGVSSARYLKVEDGEIFPCLAAGSVSEGTDIDAVEILGRALKKSALLILKVTVSLALLAYLLSTTDLDALQRRVRAGDTVLLAFAMALYACILAISTWRWRVLLEAQGYTAPLAQLSGSYLVAQFFNNFLPSNIGGDVIRVRDSSRLTGSTTTSLAVVAIDRILGLGALYALAVTAYIAGGTSVRELAGADSVLLLLGFVFAALAYVFFRPGIARRVVGASGLARLPWALKRFETVQAAVHVYRAQMPAVWKAFLGSVALQAIVVYYYFTVARSLRIPLPLSACFLMVPLCTLVQTVPISFNGWGIRESVFILYFGQVGLGRESALAFSLVGAGLIVLMSLSGAIVWTTRETAPATAPPAAPPGA